MARRLAVVVADAPIRANCSAHEGIKHVGPAYVAVVIGVPSVVRLAAGPSEGKKVPKNEGLPVETPWAADGLSAFRAPCEESAPASGYDLAVTGGVNRGARPSSDIQARQAEAEEDRGLIERAQQGDKQAFRALVERHQRRAFAIAVGLVRDEHDAREVVQEAFLRVYRGLDRFKGGSSFFTWLYRIVTNLAIDLMRKPARREAESLDYALLEEEPDVPFLARIAEADPADVVRRSEIAERINRALDALPPYHRGVILMREVEGMSYEEMAQAMGVSKGTIMSRLFHARQKLQRALADCYEEQFGMRPPKGAAP